MAATLEELELRVEALEVELAMLRRAAAANGSEVPMIRQARAQQRAISEAWEKAMQRMGISGKPISPEELQKMTEACGVKPENNEFSRGIIEMREE